MWGTLFEGLCHTLSRRCIGQLYTMGAQWLSGRVLDSRPRAAGWSLTGVTVLLSLSKTHLS